MATCRCLLAGRRISSYFSRSFSVSSRNDLFWESDPKSGYGKQIKFKLSMIIDGFKQLKAEFQLFKEEWKEHWEQDPMLFCEPGIETKVWDFRKSKDLNTWVTSADSDHSEGFSQCSFVINTRNHALFSGVLSTDVPKDGVIKRSGYCAVRTIRAMKSFKRESYMNWAQYTHLVIRCRGDGRTYMLNVYSAGYYDQFWNDCFHYPLYTRGGPYWQITRIPFSKFFFSSKGRIQDRQRPLDQELVSHFGITAADKTDGPFQLEIDYIALLYDPSQTEEFAYENYKLEKGIAAT